MIRALKDVFAVEGSIVFFPVDPHDQKKGRIFGGVENPSLLLGQLIDYPKNAANDPKIERVEGESTK